MTDRKPEAGSYAVTPRTTLHRRKPRGAYDRATVHAILDEALVCHLGFAEGDQPFVLPTTFVRDGESLFVHGAAGGRFLRTIAAGVPVCVTVTLLDGLVLARSAFHHSMNYRSVVVFGVAHEVTEREPKLHAMRCLVDKISPGRSSQARAPNEQELAATSILAIPLEEVSAKIRSGPPLGEENDMGRAIWAGVVPVHRAAGAPVPHEPLTAPYEEPVLPLALRRSP
jgi:nitroimidazol reductase NimA-like FMN-containing flavoprotein (pyridoxamine 5'-phosphate oxidase superfamily)